MLDHLFLGQNQKYIIHTKVPMATKLEGGGGGLWPSIPANSERIFFGLP